MPRHTYRESIPPKIEIPQLKPPPAPILTDDNRCSVCDAVRKVLDSGIVICPKCYAVLKGVR